MLNPQKARKEKHEGRLEFSGNLSDLTMFFLQMLHPNLQTRSAQVKNDPNLQTTRRTTITCRTWPFWTKSKQLPVTAWRRFLRMPVGFLRLQKLTSRFTYSKSVADPALRQWANIFTLLTPGLACQPQQRLRKACGPPQVTSSKVGQNWSKRQLFGDGFTTLM